MAEATPREGGVGRHDHREPLGEPADEFVAALVADRVVDRLEAVDVEIDDRRLAAPAGLGEGRAFADLAEAETVGEAGEAVGAGSDDGLLLALGLQQREATRADRRSHCDQAKEAEHDADGRQDIAQHGGTRRGRCPDEMADRVAEDVDHWREGRILIDGRIVEMQVVDEEGPAEIGKALAINIEAHRQ